MHNELNPSEGPEQREPRSVPAERLTDREVPLDSGRIPAVIHAWLDGNVTEAEVRASDAAPHMEFWKKLSVDVEAYRTIRPPADLSERIMTALPTTTPATAFVWYKRPVTMSSAAALATGAALLAAGALLASAMR